MNRAEINEKRLGKYRKIMRTQGRLIVVMWAVCLIEVIMLMIAGVRLGMQAHELASVKAQLADVQTYASELEQGMIGE